MRKDVRTISHIVGDSDVQHQDIFTYWWVDPPVDQAEDALPTEVVGHNTREYMCFMHSATFVGCVNTIHNIREKVGDGLIYFSDNFVALFWMLKK